MPKTEKQAIVERSSGPVLDQSSMIVQETTTADLLTAVAECEAHTIGGDYLEVIVHDGNVLEAALPVLKGSLGAGWRVFVINYPL